MSLGVGIEQQAPVRRSVLRTTTAVLMVAAREDHLEEACLTFVEALRPMRRGEGEKESGEVVDERGRESA